jgi:ankyrin repeat protein
MRRPFALWPAGILALALLAASARPAEIHDAAKAGDLAKVQALVAKDTTLVNAKDETGRTPLHWACRGVHVEVVKFLAGRGADVDARDANGVRPLHSVASRGHLEAAGVLLDRGASVEARMSDGSTPLHLAAANGHADLAALLVDKGALSGVRDDREDTPLQAAAREGRWEVVGLLADRVKPGSGAVLDNPDFDGATLLHLASEAGRADIVKLLVAKGAAIDARTTLGLSALNLAEGGGFKDVAEFLAGKGADPGPQRFPELRGPYLGQPLPGRTPRLFAKGIVSTRRGMYGTVAFSPDGREAFWKPEAPEMLFARLENGAWTPPRPVPFAAKDAVNVPFYSHDGRRLYFMAASRDAQGMDEREAIWFVEKEGPGWSRPAPFDPAVNSVSMHWQFSIDKAGDVYLNTGPGIARARFENGAYLPPEPLPPPVNEVHTEEQKYRAGELGPFISPEGDYLIYTRLRADAPRPSQLFISFRTGEGRWSEPKNLSEKLQTEGGDSMAKVTPDGKYLFFQSDRRGSGASRGLYWIDAKVVDELRPSKK